MINYDNDIICEVTKELDRLAGLTKYKERYSYFHHYLVKVENNLFAIRVPGGTVGEIEVDSNNCIERIGIDKDYVIRTYPNDVCNVMKKFEGKSLEC